MQKSVFLNVFEDRYQYCVIFVLPVFEAVLLLLLTAQ